MEIFFKKYFWTVSLGFLAIAAFLVAKTINTFLDAKFRALPEVGPEAAGSARAVVRRGSKDVSGVIARHIFNSEARPEPEKVVEATPAAAAPEASDPGGAGEESDLDVELVAVILTDHPLWSFAQIREKRTDDAQLFKIGDTIRTDARIVAIEWRRVILLRNGRRETLTMFYERPKAPIAKPAAPAVPGGPTPVAVDDRNIKKVGESEYVIDRGEVDKQLSNLNYLATQARIVPHFEGGQGAGFKLFAIRPGSLYSKIGIQNGDVIQRINGETINSPDKALEAYARLKNANQITIDLQRGGVKRTLSYRIGN